MTNSVDAKLTAWQKENRWQEIIDYLKPKIENGEGNASYFSALGFAYSQFDKYDEARYCYKQWLELEPHRAQPYYSIGYTFYDNGQWAEAIDWYDQALEIFPDYIVCLYRKGVAQLNMLKSKKAKETLSKAINVYQNITDEKWLKSQAKYYLKSIFYLGKAYYDLEQYQNALSCFKKVSNEDKRHYLAWHIKDYNLAKGFYGIKKYHEAEKILTRLSKNKMSKNYVYALLAQVQAAKNETGKAFASFETALKKYPAAYIYSRRAALHEKQGDLNKAIADYHQALRRDRVGKHKTLLALGKISLKQNKLTEAVSFFRRAIDFKKKIYDADYYEAHLALAECFHLAGEKSKAQNEYTIAAALEKEWA